MPRKPSLYISRKSCEYCGFVGADCVCGKLTQEEYALLVQGKLSEEIDKRGHVYIVRACLKKSDQPLLEDNSEQKNFVAMKQMRGLTALKNWMVVIKRKYPNVMWFRVYNQTRQSYRWHKPVKDMPSLDSF